MCYFCENDVSSTIASDLEPHIEQKAPTVFSLHRGIATQAGRRVPLLNPHDQQATTILQQEPQKEGTQKYIIIRLDC